MYSHRDLHPDELSPNDSRLAIRLCGFLDRRCAFRVVPLPFGPQNATHHHMLSLAGYLQSPSIPDLPAVSGFHGNRPCLLLGLISLASQTRCSRYMLLTLPGALTSWPWAHCLHRCNRSHSDCSMTMHCVVYHYWRRLSSRLSLGHPSLSATPVFAI